MADAAQISNAILIRNRWAMERYEAACTRLVTVLGVLILSVIGNVALIDEKRDNVYLVTDEDGRLVQMVPMARPNMPDDGVAAWTVSAVSDLMSFDFSNFRKQLQDSRYDLTSRGWRDFQAMMSDGASGIATAVEANKYVVTTVPTGPARVIEKGVMNTGRGDRYAWNIEVPVLLSYRSSEREIENNILMRVTVIRMPEYVHKDGLGIRAIVGR